jgi:RND family efflux transporter MFP subunit
MKVVVRVPSRDSPYLDVGDRARVYFDALPTTVSEGRVSRMAYQLNVNDRTLPVEIDLPNKDGRLRTGQFVRVEIQLETTANALSIPTSALYGRDAKGSATCFRVVGGRAVQARLRIGADNGTQAEVLEGLKERDVVITQARGKVSEGLPVTIREKLRPGELQ